MVYFRTRLHVGIIPNEQISRDLHQRLSEQFFLEYTDHIEHLYWSFFFFENEQDGEPVILRDEEPSSDEDLTDDELRNYLLFEEPNGSMLTAKAHVFPDSILCIAQVRYIPPVLLKCGTERRPCF